MRLTSNTTIKKLGLLDWEGEPDGCEDLTWAGGDNKGRPHPGGGEYQGRPKTDVHKLLAYAISLRNHI